MDYLNSIFNFGSSFIPPIENSSPLNLPIAEQVATENSHIGEVVKGTAPKEFSLLQKAQDACSNVLGLNQAVTISTEGAIPAKNALFICAPLKDNGDQSFIDCCQLIFNEIGKQSIGHPKFVALIPSFSTGYNGFDPKFAAQTFIDGVIFFLLENPNCEICIATYCSKDEKHDLPNYNAYQEVLSTLSCPAELRQRLMLMPGQIEEMEADIVIVPVGQNVTYPGAVANAIEKAAKQNMAMKKASQSIDNHLAVNLFNQCPPENLFNQCPPELCKHIFSFCSLSSIGNLPRVCQIFNKFLADDLFWKGIAHNGIVTIPDPLKINHNFKEYVKSEVEFNWEFNEMEDLCLAAIDLGFYRPLLTMETLAMGFRQAAQIVPEFRRACKLLLEGKNKSEEHFHIGSQESYNNTPTSVLAIIIRKNGTLRTILEGFFIGSDKVFTIVDAGYENQYPHLVGKTITGAQAFEAGNRLLSKIEKKLIKFHEEEAKKA